MSFMKSARETILQFFTYLLSGREGAFLPDPPRQYAFKVKQPAINPGPRPGNAMNRKDFLVLSGFGLAALSLPAACQLSQRRERLASLARPIELSKVCDTPALVAIGARYLKEAPTEGEEDLLADLLSEGRKGPPDSLAQLLLERIRADYENNDTLILEGWLLSRTEARQCALLSFIQQD